MVFALFVGLFCGVRTAEAATKSATRTISVYDKAEYVGSIKVTIKYTYNNSTVNITSCSIDGTSYSGGYIIKNVTYSTTSGTSAKCTVRYDLYLRSYLIKSSGHVISVNNKGQIS